VELAAAVAAVVVVVADDEVEEAVTTAAGVGVFFAVAARLSVGHEVGSACPADAAGLEMGFQDFVDVGVEITIV
jgi:hypothetical protein